MKTFPTLYKRTNTGAIQMWSIAVSGTQIITKFGQVDGKVQETVDAVKAGKNAGRSNATTAQGQALMEAEAKHLRQCKKGYVDSAEDAAAGATDEVIEGGILPMLAHPYEKAADKLAFPCAVQPKLDGHRCIAIYAGGEVTLWTRSRKRITSVPHVEAAVKALLSRVKEDVDKVILDGELYNHAYHNNFEEITSLLRCKEPAPGHEVIEYHIYDLVKEGADYASRQAILDGLALNSKTLKAVETRWAETADEMWEHYKTFKTMGYEGAVARNGGGMYEGKRSANLLKLKEFLDEEIPDSEYGRGPWQTSRARGRFCLPPACDRWNL